MSDDLVERAMQKTIDRLHREQADMRAKLAEQAAEIRSLREQVAKAEAAEHRARLEGAEVMREAAARVIRSGMHNEYARPQPALTAAVLALDPAAILSEHARRKAMDELIAGDADLLDEGQSTSTR